MCLNQFSQSCQQFFSLIEIIPVKDFQSAVYLECDFRCLYTLTHFMGRSVWAVQHWWIRHAFVSGHFYLILLEHDVWEHMCDLIRKNKQHAANTKYAVKHNMQITPNTFQLVKTFEPAAFLTVSVWLSISSNRRQLLIEFNFSSPGSLPPALQTLTTKQRHSLCPQRWLKQIIAQIIAIW